MRKASLSGSVMLALLLIASSTWAQTATGQITGTVRDTSGGVMSGVKVVVTNQQNGLTRETKTTATGDYVVPLLPVGNYVVTAEQSGFKMALTSEVPLTVDQIQRVDMQLEAGALSETVEVRSAAIALDTGSATVGHTITEKQVTELPLNGRNFLQLLFLGAGAVETTGEQGGMRQGAGNAISIMGARPTSNNFMIDGTANIDTSLGTPAAILSVDAIQEFKEQTTTYSAEYGFSSNQINIVSKTGTNQFRGTAFGFFRNEAWDARNYFDNKNNPAPKLDQKQFGFVVGGPVLLPMYNGRNRTFFLANYEGTRIDRGATNFYTVPTPDQLAGRFNDDDPRPSDRSTVPQQHHSDLPVLTARPTRAQEQLVSHAEQHDGAGKLRSGPNVPAGAGSVHAPGRSGPLHARTRLRALHEDDLREHDRGSDDRRRQPACSIRKRRTGRCRTPGRSARTW